MKIRTILSITILAGLLSLLAACRGEQSQPAADEAGASGAPTATLQEAVDPPPESASPTTAKAQESPPTASAMVPATGPPASETRQESTIEAVETIVPDSLDPVEVAYFTPLQQEGPYYPVEKLAERDNDLAALAGAQAAPLGQILEFGGTVYDAGGYPLQGAVVEIWQTDANGVYLHPGDPSTDSRDRNFQFYGEALTGADGRYSFRTVLPGLYEPRPRHIHVKVRLDGQELLTTQFYFAGEIDLQGADALMLIDAQPELDEEGRAVLIGERDIFLNVSR